MANNIDTSAIVDPTKQQPFLGGSLAFLQAGNTEIVKGIAIALMGSANYALSSTKVIILSGCNWNAGTTIIFEGLVFYNQEIYYFPGANISGYANVPVFQTDFTNPSPDPITFSDGSTGNVHNQRRLKVVDAVSGTGLCDVKDAIYISQNNGTTISLSNFAAVGGALAALPGATYTTPKSITGLKRKFKIKVYGLADFTVTGTNTEGWNIDLYNSTTSTVLTASSFSISTTLTGGQSIAQSGVLCAEYKGSFEGNTTIIARIQGTNGNYINSFFVVEEYH